MSVTRFKNDKNFESSTIEKSLEVVEEIVSHATIKIKKYYPNAKIDVSVPENIIFVPMDCVIIEQVLINLVENVIRHGKTNEVKNVPRSFINKEGNFVTEEMLTYLRPLIVGEPKVSYQDGLPQYASLEHLYR